jgi:hypothetical protein
MKNVSYLFKARDGFSITGWKNGPSPDTKLIKVQGTLSTQYDEPLFNLRVCTPTKSLNLFRRLMHKLNEYGDNVHSLDLSAYNEGGISPSTAECFFHPSGRFVYISSVPYFSSETGFLLPERRTNYKANITDNPKKIGKSGYPFQKFQEIISKIFPENQYNELRSIDHFDLKVNLIGRAFDLRISYEEFSEDDAIDGAVTIYSPFSKSKRRKKRNKQEEITLLSTFLSDMFEITEIRGGKKRTLETMISELKKEIDSNESN